MFVWTHIENYFLFYQCLVVGKFLKLSLCPKFRSPWNHFVSFSDSISILNDVQFEDVSNSRKAYCWKYFLYANVKPNQKAKCQVETSKGEYCNKIFCATRGSTSALNTHLKNAHGINELSSFLRLNSNL